MKETTIVITSADSVVREQITQILLGKADRPLQLAGLSGMAKDVKVTTTEKGTVVHFQH